MDDTNRYKYLSIFDVGSSALHLRFEYMQTSLLGLFLDSKLFSAIVGGSFVSIISFFSSKRKLHRSQAETLLTLKRQLLRQFRDLMTLREFYEPQRHAEGYAFKMKMVIMGFCDERIKLASTDFMIRYVKSPMVLDTILEADLEYQCVLSTYRKWMESHLNLAERGKVTRFDQDTGKAFKEFQNNDVIMLKVHLDYSAALIQTLDRAIELNIKASEVVDSTVESHRKICFLRFILPPRTPNIVNSAKGLSKSSAKDLVPKSIEIAADVKSPFAVVVGPVWNSEEYMSTVTKARVCYAHSPNQDISGSAIRISFQEASLLSRNLNHKHFYWVDEGKVILADAWHYIPSVEVGSEKMLVRRM